MEVTEVRIHKNKGYGTVKGIANIVLDNGICVNGISIIQRNNEFCYISFPKRITKEEGFRDIAHPINADTRNKIQKAILEEFNKKLRS